MLIKLYKGSECTPEQAVKYVPQGWRNLALKLIDDLFKAGWDGCLGQIKEKFGELRLYPRGSWTEEMTDLYTEARFKSREICVVCGEPGTMFLEGWMSPYCDEHKPKGDNLHD